MTVSLVVRRTGEVDQIRDALGDANDHVST